MDRCLSELKGPPAKRFGKPNREFESLSVLKKEHIANIGKGIHLQSVVNSGSIPDVFSIKIRLEKCFSLISSYLCL